MNKKVDERHAKGFLPLGGAFKLAKQCLISNDLDIKNLPGVLACQWREPINRM